MAKKVEKAQSNAENAPIAKVTVELKNCYGIKALKETFDFTKSTSYAIYAPNGSMKSSFANTFNDIAEDRPSQDRIFKNRKTDRKITNNDRPIGKSQVLVVSPYDDNYLSHTEKVSTLLVNSELREEYEKLYIEVNKCKTTFLDKIKEQANSKKDMEKEISLAFTKRDDFLDRALNRINGEVDDNGLIPFADIKYDIVFDQKVIEFLGTEDFKNIINDYIRRYNELLGNSVYFKRGIFNYYNAETIAKNLSDNGFFEANHSVNLNAAEKTEISDARQLKKIIADEKESIANDSELKKKFQKIEKAITKNINLRVFQDYIEQREDILPQLANIEDFREKVIKAYIHENIDSYKELLKQYETTEKRKKDIEAEADKQRTQWESVINEFNDRFFVPFKLNIKNKVQVILGQDSIPTLGFVFKEGEDSIDIEKTDLMNALSTGERKAFYILNVIFEIKARRHQAVETLLIFDDIADSFDYKNKYAIIQYLRDISEYPNFKMIILTHNFDFYRTIASRFVRYDACKMAIKNEEGITLNNAAGIRNIFINDWKPHFFNDITKKLASIPFMRNIIEYTHGENDPDYQKLTSLLHYKNDTSEITIKDINDIYHRLFGTSGATPSDGDKVYQELRAVSDTFRNASESINFENKIILSISIRLFAESFMIHKINDELFVNGIAKNQTFRLFDKYKAMFPEDTISIEILQRVLLMTPENIHLNSFMYEPILDMSDQHLRKLYTDICSLDVEK